MATAEETSNPPISLPISEPSSNSYVFKPSENALLTDLASKMRFVGLFGMTIGVLVLLLGVINHDVGHIISGFVSAMMGAWTKMASEPFEDVAESPFKDIPHLMDALGHLRRLYTMQFWLCVFAFLSVLGAFMVVAVAIRAHSAM